MQFFEGRSIKDVVVIGGGIWVLRSLFGKQKVKISKREEEINKAYIIARRSEIKIVVNNKAVEPTMNPTNVLDRILELNKSSRPEEREEIESLAVLFGGLLNLVGPDHIEENSRVISNLLDGYKDMKSAYKREDFLRARNFLSEACEDLAEQVAKCGPKSVEQGSRVIERFISFVFSGRCFPGEHIKFNQYNL